LVGLQQRIYCDVDSSRECRHVDPAAGILVERKQVEQRLCEHIAGDSGDGLCHVRLHGTDLAWRGCRLSSYGIDGPSHLLPGDEARGTAALSLQACTELPDPLVGQLDQRHLYVNLPGTPVYQANGLFGNSQVIRGSDDDYLPVLDVGNHNSPATIL